ncbi:MAG TPA: chromate transporter [Burkholderiaceae bacterium]|nr:chromate transporter [Burkholderiaceae bacterium]
MIGAAELLSLFAHFALLSLLAVGGMIAMAPEMHRYLVDSRGWIDHLQFVDSIAIAQAAPGPNVLFVTLLGWQVAGFAGAFVATAGALLPSSTLTYFAQRGLSARRDWRSAKALRLGLSPIAIGFTLATGWVLATAIDTNWRLAAMTVAAVVFMMATSWNPLWLLAAGAALGAFGLL